MQVIGIDCASDPAKVGIARSRSPRGTPPLIQEVRHGLSLEELVATLSTWIQLDPNTLLALDAPLGWPTQLRTGLATHTAGQPLPGHADQLFLRHTDHAIWKRLGKRPLEVGADRIARAARSALALLQALREKLSSPIPLLWSPEAFLGPGAIEVYPAATLRVHGLDRPSYKKPEQAQARIEILRHLESKMFAGPLADRAAECADILDACVCVLAGHDFLCDRAARPTDLRLAEQEGWIWA